MIWVNYCTGRIGHHKFMYVCICHAVTDSAIREVVDHGASSFRELSDATGCGKQCGCCVAQVREVMIETLAGQGSTASREQSMKGDPKVIEFLNRVLRNELTAINQYFLHSRMFKDWGLDGLGDYEFQESVDEMKHADQLIERILFLEGLPNLQGTGKLRIGEHTQEMLECDLALEMEAIPELRSAVEYSESRKDFVSRDLFDSILQSEEEHVDWLETQLDLISKVGIENYQQSQIK
jgi:bacterioferritin